MDIEKANQTVGSYNLESFTDNKESEVNRLKFQVDLFYEKELELYKMIGLKDRMNIVECGSGPGFLISNIVRDLPDCTATAVEIDPYLVEQLNKRAVTKGKKLFEVKHSSIYDTELPDNSFDFAIARLVLEHLTEPEKAITEVRRILKPGGIFVVVSNDFAYHLLTYPAIEELEKMYRAYIKSRYAENGNPLIARQLPGLLKKGDFKKININIICVHNEIEGDKPLLKAENVNISKTLVRDGFLKEVVLESLISKWYKMLQHPDHAIFRQLFVISGVKGSLVPVSYKPNQNNQETDTNSSINDSLNTGILKGMNPELQKTALTSYFVRKVKANLEKSDNDPAPDIKLNDFDIDSIAAAELSSIAKSDFNTVITISEILQKFSINDIVSVILENTGSIQSEASIPKFSKPENSWLEGEL
jgi:ubiquinone/menaquinone biosynthesis C-methylase UbiE/acyl carrier protein